MANQRKEGKKKLQVWLEETERKQLSELANAHGYGSVTAFLQAVANGEVRTASDEESQLPKSAKRAAKKS